MEIAIKHGQRGVSSGGIIRITAREEPEETLVITVSDNGHGMDGETVRQITEQLEQAETKEDDHYRIGMSKVHQRIRILFGEPYGLTIESKPGTGTAVMIRIPARGKEALEEYVQGNHRG